MPGIRPPAVTNPADATNHTLFDAKGDILTATAADTPAKLSVGNNGEFLAVDTDAATDLRWMLTPYAQPPVVDDYISPHHTTRSAASAVLDILYLMPIWLPIRSTFDRIAFEVTTADAGSQVRLGVYAHNHTTGKAGSVELDAGRVGAGATGVVEITINATFGPGLFWLALAPQVAATTLATRRCASGPMATPSQSAADATGVAVRQSYINNSMSGAFTANPTFDAVAVAVPLVALRRSA